MKLYRPMILLAFVFSIAACTTNVRLAETTPSIVTASADNQMPAAVVTQPPAVASELQERHIAYSNKDRQCLAEAIYYESRGESTQGQVAVGYVVMNRVEHKAFPKTICQVVYQKTAFRGKTVCQFSWACQPVRYARRNQAQYDHAMQVADMVLNRTVANPIGHSLFFHERRIRVPRFSHSQRFVALIGNHRFYAAR